MPTFVEELQSVAAGDDPEFRRRTAARIEAVGDAIGVLETWTERSRETRTELVSKYETAKSLARDEIREGGAESADGDAPDAIRPADLLDHADVTDDTKRRLREYSTKLHAFLDEEESYGGARERLRTAVEAELHLYERLLADLETGACSVRDAQAAVARFAREETPGPANATATDVLLDVESDGA